MTKDHRMKIALSYDDWARISRAVSDTGSADNDGHLLALAAALERGIGHSAVAGALEAASERAFGGQD